MPVPSGSRSSRRIGNGFQISKTRKSIKPARKVFQAERDGDECNQLPRDFIDDDELRVFQAGGACDPRGGGNADEGHNRGGDDGCPGAVSRPGFAKLANAHRITVASDPQVPGPGLRRPAPKKVATSVAHNGARGRDAPAIVDGTPALRLGEVSINL